MIYLASPYSHPDPLVMESRWKQVCLIAGRLMNAGHVVFSPIAHGHPIAAQYSLPTGWDFWQRYVQEFIQVSDKVVVAMMDGWRESVGVRAEVRFAHKIGKPVEYLEP